jgi:multiple sugar transport system permease protein
MVPLSILLGLIFALLIDSTFVKARRFFRLAFFAPYAVPGVIASIMWLYFYAPSLSPLPQLANSIDLLNSPAIIFAIINIVVWTVAGFNMLILYSALQSIPQELYEAANLDGASNLRVALSIKVPLIMPSIIMTLVLSMIGTLQLFTEPTVLKTVSQVIGSDYTPNMLVFATAAVPNYNLAAAFSVVLALITAALSFVFFRLTRRRAFS